MSVSVVSELLGAEDLPQNRYLDREESWLRFNQRVLELAEDEDVPLLERVRFLAIFASNLDEFFMVRVAGLTRRLATGLPVKTATRQATAPGARPHSGGHGRADAAARGLLPRGGASGPDRAGHRDSALGRAVRDRTPEPASPVP